MCSVSFSCRPARHSSLPIILGSLFSRTPLTTITANIIINIVVLLLPHLPTTTLNYIRTLSLRPCLIFFLNQFMFNLEHIHTHFTGDTFSMLFVFSLKTWTLTSFSLESYHRASYSTKCYPNVYDYKTPTHKDFIFVDCKELQIIRAIFMFNTVTIEWYKMRVIWFVLIVSLRVNIYIICNIDGNAIDSVWGHFLYRRVLSSSSTSLCLSTFQFKLSLLSCRHQALSHLTVFAIASVGDNILNTNQPCSPRPCHLRLFVSPVFSHKQTHQLHWQCSSEFFPRAWWSPYRLLSYCFISSWALCKLTLLSYLPPCSLKILPMLDKSVSYPSSCSAGEKRMRVRYHIFILAK